MSALDDVRDVPESWEVVRSDERFRGKVLGVRTDGVRMPNGNGTEIVDREVVVHPGSVAILALDDADRVLLIRQYRHPVGKLLWEIPAGLRDVPGEPLWRTAERELIEEAGYLASRWDTLIDVFPSPGMSDERSRIFLARDLKQAPVDENGRVLDAGGNAFERIHEEADMPCVWLPLDEAVRKVTDGAIHNQLAAVGILAAYAIRSTGFRDLRAPETPET